MKNKDILQLFKERGKPLNMTLFQLWWRRHISGNIEVLFLYDKIGANTNIIKVPWLKCIFLFEKIESKLLNKKGIFLANYFFNGDETTLKKDIPLLFHNYCLAKQREGHEGIFVVISKHNEKDIKYFYNMDFIYNMNENILYQEEFKNTDYIILTKKV